MKKSRRLSGFTLIEMIIVMALFTVLMLAAFMLYQPVARLFKRTSVNERTYSYTNNIDNIIQGQLDDADNVWIYSGNLSNNDLSDICTLFKTNYYNNMVIGTGRNSQAPAEGTIHIMHVLNNDATIGGTAYPSGQIVVSDVPFECADGVNVSETDVRDAAATSLLPNAYFRASDAGRYSFNYCLGTGTLRSVAAPAGTSDNYRALDIDMDPSGTVPLGSQNLSMTVVVTGDSVTPGGASFVDDSGYRAFREPCSMSSIGIPLSRINSVERGHTPRGVYYRGADTAEGNPFYANDRGNITITESVMYNRTDLTTHHTEPTDVSVDFGSDIYFIYTYEEEFHT